MVKFHEAEEMLLKVDFPELIYVQGIDPKKGGLRLGLPQFLGFGQASPLSLVSTCLYY